jgi:hypothetical protein
MNNSLLYCSGCTSTGAWLSPLQTGILTGAYQLGKLQVHSSSRPRKKLNGRFPSLDPDDYVEAMRQIGHSGVSAIMTKWNAAACPSAERTFAWRCALISKAQAMASATAASRPTGAFVPAVEPLSESTRTGWQLTVEHQRASIPDRPHVR